MSREVIYGGNRRHRIQEMQVIVDKMRGAEETLIVLGII